MVSLFLSCKHIVYIIFLITLSGNYPSLCLTLLKNDIKNFSHPVIVYTFILLCLVVYPHDINLYRQIVSNWNITSSRKKLTGSFLYLNGPLFPCIRHVSTVFIKSKCHTKNTVGRTVVVSVIKQFPYTSYSCLKQRSKQRLS